MTDKELADKVVACGVAARSSEAYALIGDDPDNFYTYAMNKAEHFVRDWRVAGALMEAKCWGVNTEAHVVPIGQIREYIARNESPTRAIIEAYVLGLETND